MLSVSAAAGGRPRPSHSTATTRDVVALRAARGAAPARRSSGTESHDGQLRSMRADHRRRGDLPQRPSEQSSSGRRPASANRADGVDHRLAGLPRQVKSTLRWGGARGFGGDLARLDQSAARASGRACGRSARRRAPGTGASRRSAPSRRAPPCSRQATTVVRGVSISALLGRVAQQMVVAGDGSLVQEAQRIASGRLRPRAGSRGQRLQRELRGDLALRCAAHAVGEREQPRVARVAIAHAVFVFLRPPLRLTWKTEKRMGRLRPYARQMQVLELAASAVSRKLQLGVLRRSVSRDSSFCSANTLCGRDSGSSAHAPLDDLDEVVGVDVAGARAAQRAGGPSRCAAARRGRVALHAGVDAGADGVDVGPRARACRSRRYISGAAKPGVYIGRMKLPSLLSTSRAAPKSSSTGVFVVRDEDVRRLDVQVQHLVRCTSRRPCSRLTKSAG